MTPARTYASAMAAVFLWCLASGSALGWCAGKREWSLSAFTTALFALSVVNAAAGAVIRRGLP